MVLCTMPSISKLVIDLRRLSGVQCYLGRGNALSLLRWLAVSIESLFLATFLAKSQCWCAAPGVAPASLRQAWACSVAIVGLMVYRLHQ